MRAVTAFELEATRRQEILLQEAGAGDASTARQPGHRRVDVLDTARDLVARLAAAVVARGAVAGTR